MCSPGVLKMAQIQTWAYYKSPLHLTAEHQDLVTTKIRQLKTTWPSIIRPAPNSENVRTLLQSQQDYTRYDAHPYELLQLLPTQPVSLLASKTKDGLSQKVLPRALMTLFIFGENTKTCSQKEYDTNQGSSPTGLQGTSQPTCTYRREK